jgi:phytoene dehydrogenase-like protein
MLGQPPSADRRKQRWGAIADGEIAHHQVLIEPNLALGEANSAFVSISAAGGTRARRGGRAITISSHTDPQRWYDASANGTLDSLKREYARRLMRALSLVTPGVEPELFEIGTPLTFERYTGRYRGLVGGVPALAETSNLFARSHRTEYANLLLCGDTVFPGQSTVGVTLSAVNAVRALGVELDSL